MFTTPFYLGNAHAPIPTPSRTPPTAPILAPTPWGTFALHPALPRPEARHSAFCKAADGIFNPQKALIFSKRAAHLRQPPARERMPRPRAQQPVSLGLHTNPAPLRGTGKENRLQQPCRMRHLSRIPITTDRHHALRPISGTIRAKSSNNSRRPLCLSGLVQRHPHETQLHGRDGVEASRSMSCHGQSPCSAAGTR